MKKKRRRRKSSSLVLCDWVHWCDAAGGSNRGKLCCLAARFGTVQVPAHERRLAGWSLTRGWKPADWTAKLAADSKTLLAHSVPPARRWSSTIKTHLDRYWHTVYAPHATIRTTKAHWHADVCQTKREMWIVVMPKRGPQTDLDNQSFPLLLYTCIHSVQQLFYRYTTLTHFIHIFAYVLLHDSFSPPKHC